MGGNSPEDERRFETAKRVSEMNLEAYRKYLQPWVKSMVTPQMAELTRNWHPLRWQYEAFSSQNPFMTAVENAADKARDDRKPAAKDNPFLAFQERMSKQIVSSLDQWRDSTEALSEAMFLAIYGSPALQAAVGVDPQSAPSRRRAMDPKHREFLQARIAELKSKIGSGGLREAGSRALVQRVLVGVLDAILRLVQPIMPFLAESIWQALTEATFERGLPSPDPASATAGGVWLAVMLSGPTDPSGFGNPTWETWIWQATP